MRIRLLSALLLALFLLPLPASATAARPLDETENYLLLGSDVEPGQGIWRTDTIIIAAVDRAANRVGLISVPRDLLVNIPGAGRNRINTVDYIGERRYGPGGGPRLISEVLEQTLGIRTQHYMRVDMGVVTRLIDQIGGITIVLDEPFTEDVPDPELLKQGKRVPLRAGAHHMDGETALAYLRARYVTGDLDRTRRQQQVIWAVGQRIREMGWLSQLPLLWPVLSQLETDLSQSEVLSLAWFGSALQPEDVHGLTFNYSLAVPWTTELGAQVLLLADRRRIDPWIDGIFDAPCVGCREGSPPPPAVVTVELPPPSPDQFTVELPPPPATWDPFGSSGPAPGQ